MRVFLILPLPPGFTAAFVFNKEGAPIYSEKNTEASPIKNLSYHQAINAQQAEEKGWHRVSEIGSQEVFYVESQHIRYWQEAPPPYMLKDSEIWLDAHLIQQMIALYKGKKPLFVTLMSSAKPGSGTPKGIFRIFAKHIQRTFSSVKGARSRYHIERIPWVMKFYPLYAIHTAFWHNDFGHRKSHGWINLSMKDAKYIYDRVEPKLEPGWAMAKQKRGKLRG